MHTNHPPEKLRNNPRFAGGQIPPAPQISGHRRAFSENFFHLPDEFLLDSDPDFNFSDIDFPSLSDDNISGSSSTAAVAIPAVSGEKSKPFVLQPASGGHLRSLSLDTAFFDGFMGKGDNIDLKQEKKLQHRHSSSMDGMTSLFEGESMFKASVAADKLAELALIDPKRAKRILANRQSAARSKERKIRHTSELEQMVQTLQTEATTLLAQLTMLQRESTSLTTENRELKLRLQSMEQQAHLRDALNEALREEVQRLKMATSQAPNMNGNSFNLGFNSSSSPYFSHPLSSHLNQQLNSTRSPSPNGFKDQNVHDSMDLI